MGSVFGKMLRIIGMHNAGKTQVVEGLVEELCRRGWRVGTIKHSSHRHSFDRSGSDTDRHRKAGARLSAIVARGECAVFLPEPDERDPYTTLAPLYESCDIVIVEGHAAAPGEKIEVWSSGCAEPPLAANRTDIVAVVSDVEPGLDLEWLRRDDVHALADLAERMVGLCGAATRAAPA